VSKKTDFGSMSINELWNVYEEISQVLKAKMVAEKETLEHRLVSMKPALTDRAKSRRPYPPVVPKFANPDEPSQVWSGRGKRPKWVLEKLASGLTFEDLNIARGSSVAMRDDHLAGDITGKPSKSKRKVHSR
jgi:DNA-binding protein H-NS